MSVDKRTYHREYARRKRREAWAQVAETKERCPAMLANQRRCGWRLENRLVAGVTVPFCAQCDRKARGICLDCQREPVVGTVGRALRCSGCQVIERYAAQERYHERHPAKRRRQWQRRKKRFLANPELHRAQLERKRLWRQASPKAKARYAKQYNQTESAKRYYKAYREARREHLRAQARMYQAAKARGERLTHPCMVCRTPVSGRAKKCDVCRRAQYTAARAALTGAAA